jgi:carbon monoxide dehydrogenase subunit G
MKVALERSFLMPGSVDAAWAVLQDIEAVAGCMPGAAITERIDAAHYKGAVSVKLGPATMAFRGTIEVVELDAARHLVHLLGKGSDSTGTSAATLDLTARIEPGPDAGGSTLHGSSEINISGKAAAFGGRLMTTVSDQILKDFAANFADDVRARAVQSAAAQPGTQPPAAPAGPQPAIAQQASAQPMSAAAAQQQPAGAPPQAARAPAPASPRSPPPAAAVHVAARRGRRELSAFGLLWAIVRDAVLGLFGRGPRSGHPRVP